VRPHRPQILAGDNGTPIWLCKQVVGWSSHGGGKLRDLLIAAVGGRERTERQWRALLFDGGFQLAGIQPGQRASISAAQGDQRGAAGHRHHHDQAEWFFPADWDQQAGTLASSSLLVVTETPVDG
jgi:hypothetical protein